MLEKKLSFLKKSLHLWERGEFKILEEKVHIGLCDSNPHSLQMEPLFPSVILTLNVGLYLAFQVEI